MTVEPQAVANGRSFTDDYLLFLLAQASAVASEEFHLQLHKDGIAVSTWRIIASLYPDLSLTVGALAEKCLLKQPTLTRTLDRLEEDGLTKRIHSKTDRRAVLVALTDKGKKVGDEKTALAKTHEQHILSGYSELQKSDLTKSLRRLMIRNQAE